MFFYTKTDKMINCVVCEAFLCIGGFVNFVHGSMIPFVFRERQDNGGRF